MESKFVFCIMTHTSTHTVVRKSSSRLGNRERNGFLAVGGQASASHCLDIFTLRMHPNCTHWHCKSGESFDRVKGAEC